MELRLRVGAGALLTFVRGAQCSSHYRFTLLLWTDASAESFRSAVKNLKNFAMQITFLVEIKMRSALLGAASIAR